MKILDRIKASTLCGIAAIAVLTAFAMIAPYFAGFSIQGQVVNPGVGLGSNTFTGEQTITASGTALSLTAGNLLFGTANGACWNSDTGIFRYSSGAVELSTSCSSPNDSGSMLLQGLDVRAVAALGGSGYANLALGTGSAGSVFSRNEADAFAAFTVEQESSSSTGDVLDLENSAGIQSRFLQQGNLLLAQSGSQQTCSSTTEGATWYTKGTGSANGTFAICQNQSGTYEWVTH